MDENIVHKYVNKLSGNILIFNKNDDLLKVYQNEREKDLDIDFSNPMKISEFSSDLMHDLLINSDANVRYNSARILNAQIDNDIFSEKIVKELLKIVDAQLTLEKHKRVKALVSNVLSKKLNIDTNTVIALIIKALEEEPDKWWEFELAAILLAKERKINGNGGKYLDAYTNKYGLSSTQEKFYNDMRKNILLYQITDFILGFFKKDPPEKVEVDEFEEETVRADDMLDRVSKGKLLEFRI